MNNTCRKFQLIALLLLTFTADAIAQDLEYELFSDHKRIGRISISLAEKEYNSQSVLEVSTHTQIKIKALLLTLYKFESEETYLQDSSGVLRYNCDMETDGERILISGARSDSAFIIEYMQKGATQERLFGLSDFDYTSLDDSGIEFSAPGLGYKYRVLDMDMLQVVERSYRWVRDDSLSIEGQQVPCHVIDIKDVNSSRLCRRWVAHEDGDILLKEDGIDERGDSYRVKLVGLDDE